MSNMYDGGKTVKTWNPFVGCRFNCVYCKPSLDETVMALRWAYSNTAVIVANKPKGQ